MKLLIIAVTILMLSTYAFADQTYFRCNWKGAVFFGNVPPPEAVACQKRIMSSITDAEWEARLVRERALVEEAEKLAKEEAMKQVKLDNLMNVIRQALGEVLAAEPRVSNNIAVVTSLHQVIGTDAPFLLR